MKNHFHDKFWALRRCWKFFQLDLWPGSLHFFRRTFYFGLQKMRSIRKRPTIVKSWVYYAIELNFWLTKSIVRSSACICTKYESTNIHWWNLFIASIGATITTTSSRHMTIASKFHCSTTMKVTAKQKLYNLISIFVAKIVAIYIYV